MAEFIYRVLLTWGKQPKRGNCEFATVDYSVFCTTREEADREVESLIHRDIINMTYGRQLVKKQLIHVKEK